MARAKHAFTYRRWYKIDDEGEQQEVSVEEASDMFADPESPDPHPENVQVNQGDDVDLGGQEEYFASQGFVEGDPNTPDEEPAQEGTNENTQDEGEASGANV